MSSRTVIYQAIHETSQTYSHLHFIDTAIQHHLCLFCGNDLTEYLHTKLTILEPHDESEMEMYACNTCLDTEDVCPDDLLWMSDTGYLFIQKMEPVKEKEMPWIRKIWHLK